MIQELESGILYAVGDFYIKAISHDKIRITTDKGVVIVKPEANNCILVESRDNNKNK